MKAGRFLLSMAMAGAFLWTLEVAAEEGKPVYPGKKWELKKPGQIKAGTDQKV